MNVTRISVACLFLCVSQSRAGDTASGQDPKVLFVYDQLDDGSLWYVETFGERFDEGGVDVEETEAAGADDKDPAAFDYVVIYSRVMAFNMKSPVRKWLRSLKSLDGTKAFVFVTAARWLHRKQQEGLVELLKERDATVVDAVSAATSSLSDEQKRAKIEQHLSKLAR